VKAIFFNVGWMRFYRGLDNDSIVGGGSHVDKYGEGGEIYNFLDREGITYGYVQPARGVINIDRLGASHDDPYIDDILVVWIATKPGAGPRIVGWYKHATVYRKVQTLQVKDKDKYHFVHYFVKAKTKDCHWNDYDERVFAIPRRVKGGLGQSNVWFADSKESLKIKKEIIDYIENGTIPKQRTIITSRGGYKGSLDYETRKKIEKTAVKIVTMYYRKLGYTVESREKDNIGWDLDVQRGKDKLKVEVKGNKNEGVYFELSPNEYENMLKDKCNYRIAVVSKALSANPKLRIFSFTPERDEWISKDGRVLHFTEIKAAKVIA